MCKVLEVSKSGYYKWIKSSPSKRFVENQQLTEQIRQIHQLSKQTYGSPRITRELWDRSYKVSRQRVARLMRKAGIRSKVRKKYVVTTDSKHTYCVAENLLDRNFKVGNIGQVWVSDITYIPTKESWLYLTTVIDLGDRKVIGWSLGNSLKAVDTSIAAFNMAIKKGRGEFDGRQIEKSLRARANGYEITEKSEKYLKDRDDRRRIHSN